MIKLILLMFLLSFAIVLMLTLLPLAFKYIDEARKNLDEIIWYLKNKERIK